MTEEFEFVPPGAVRWLEDDSGDVYVSVNDLSVALQMAIVENADECVKLCDPSDTFSPDELHQILLSFSDAIAEVLEALRIG